GYYVTERLRSPRSPDYAQPTVGHERQPGVLNHSARAPRPARLSTPPALQGICAGTRAVSRVSSIGTDCWDLSAYGAVAQRDCGTPNCPPCANSKCTLQATDRYKRQSAGRRGRTTSGCSRFPPGRNEPGR